MLRAVDPEKALPPLAWLPCENGVSGCVLMDTSMLPGDGTYDPNAKLGPLAGVYHYPTRTLFTVGINFDKYDKVEALYQLGKGAIAAWRANNKDNCWIGRAYLGSAGVIQSTNHDLSDTEGEELLHYGPVDQIVADTAPSVKIDKSVTGVGLRGTIRGQLGSTRMALEVIPYSTVYVWDMVGPKPIAIPKPTGINEDLHLTLRGDEVLFERDGDLSVAGIAIQHADGSVEMLYQKPGVWVSWLASDGVDVVWQELTQYDGGGGKLELWTSPWASHKASFKPRKVADLPGSLFVRGGYSGGGWYPFYFDDGTLRVIRISDGAHVDVPAPPGYGWIDPWGVVDGEIWATVHVPRDGGFGVVHSIARVPVASLGNPTP